MRKADGCESSKECLSNSDILAVDGVRWNSNSGRQAPDHQTLQSTLKSTVLSCFVIIIIIYNINLSPPSCQLPIISSFPLRDHKISTIYSPLRHQTTSKQEFKQKDPTPTFTIRKTVSERESAGSLTGTRTRCDVCVRFGTQQADSSRAREQPVSHWR